MEPDNIEKMLMADCDGQPNGMRPEEIERVLAAYFGAIQLSEKDILFAGLSNFLIHLRKTHCNNKINMLVCR